ncbi:hypothetical protein FRB90_007756 [Tulasnella sp. 427]|nr:hypothetical protein FRB90_007756 [Tulasnella sp. 427]
MPTEKLVHSVDLVLRLGSSNQFSITSQGPFKDHDAAELAVFEKAFTTGIVPRSFSVSQTSQSHAEVHAGAIHPAPNSSLHDDSNESESSKTWFIVDDEEYDELLPGDEADTPPPSVNVSPRGIKSWSRSARTPPSSSPLGHPAFVLREHEPAYPPLFTNRYAHLPSSPYAPPLQNSYGPARSKGHTPYSKQRCSVSEASDADEFLQSLFNIPDDEVLTPYNPPARPEYSQLERSAAMAGHTEATSFHQSHEDLLIYD